MPLLAGIAAFAIYLSITPVVSGLGDGPEFTVGLATCGLVHPTGYPLYVLGGHLFVRILHAFGAGWPLAANAWSGAGAAVAVALFHATARRLGVEDGTGPGLTEPVPRRAPWALLPTAVFALNPVLLREAVEAEVNSWALAWTMGIALLYTAALDRRRNGIAPGWGAAAGWGALCGLGLAHHATSVLVAAPLTAALAFAFARRGWLRARLVASAAGSAVAPLLAYGFIAWRAAHPAPGQWQDIAPTLASLLAHVTGLRYRLFLGYFAPDAVSWPLLSGGIYPFLFPGLALLGIAGAGATSAERRLACWGLLAAALVGMGFALNYGVPDPAPYFLPPTGLALLGLAPLAAGIGARGAPWRGGGFAAGLVLVALLAGKGLSEARDRRDEAVAFDRRVRRLWSLVPDQPGLLFWNADQVTRLVEYQVLEGERRGLWVASPEWLLDPPVRADLRRRYGIDPIEGLAIPYAPLSAPWSDRVRAEFLGRVLARLSAGTGLTVYEFDPTVPRLEIVAKPADAPGS